MKLLKHHPQKTIVHAKISLILSIVQRLIAAGPGGITDEISAWNRSISAEGNTPNATETPRIDAVLTR